MSHGGKRRGAGRPRSTEGWTTLSLVVRPSEAAELRSQAAAKGATLSAWIRQRIWGKSTPKKG